MRSKTLAVAISLAALAVPSFAFAAPAGAPAEHAQRADGDKSDKAEKKFPMPAAEFKAKIDGKLARARQHMETRAAKLDADKAKEVRAKFDAGAANVDAQVAKATADGTVTREEAKDVFTAMRAMHPNRGKHARKGQKAQRKPAQ